MTPTVLTAPGRTRRLLWPALSTLVMLALLLGLGTWQVRRLAWKEAILARIAQAETAPAVPLGAGPLSPFTKVRVTGTLRNDLFALYGAEVRDTRDGPQMGAQLIVPLQRPGDAPPVLVDRGWVPTQPRQAIDQPAGTVTVEGYVRAPEKPGLLSATDDPAGRRFYSLDPASIGAALGLKRVAPFVLVAMGPIGPGVFPQPAQSLPRPPNNHLSYAITWYGLAAVLAVIFVLWSRKVLRDEP